MIFSLTVKCQEFEEKPRRGRKHALVCKYSIDNINLYNIMTILYYLDTI